MSLPAAREAVVHARAPGWRRCRRQAWGLRASRIAKYESALTVPSILVLYYTSKNAQLTRRSLIRGGVTAALISPRVKARLWKKCTLAARREHAGSIPDFQGCCGVLIKKR
ncbi:hypothetical protein BDW69DRAFT_166528 [Aspergillus filifer]